MLRRAVSDSKLFSLEIPLVAHNFPFHELLQFVRVSDHVLVVLQLLVGSNDSQINASEVDLSRILLVSVPDQREVSSKVVRCVLDRVLWAWLVMQKTQFESCLSLRLLHRWLFVAQIQYLHQVLDGLT